MSAIITLLSDYGLSDYYVGAMKGAILSVEPGAKLVDISHRVPPQDVRTAAWLLACCWRDFPPGTVHLAVVDPGVGSERIPLAVRAGNHVFVGPDNGIFTYVVLASQSWNARRIAEEHFLREVPCRTFHGRDVFAPAAALLSGGAGFTTIGPQLERIEILDIKLPEVSPGRVEAAVIHIDNFGNLITNVTAKELEAAGISTDKMELELAKETISDFVTHYAAAPPRQPVALYSSAGYIEIALRDGSAQQCLDVRRSDRVSIISSQ